MLLLVMVVNSRLVTGPGALHNVLLETLIAGPSPVCVCA